MSNYSVLEYLYRDANNFKAFGQLLLSGKLTDVGIVEIKSLLESGEYFVAEQVDVPSLYSQLWKYSNGPTSSDHAYHEFIKLRSATDEETTSLEVWGDIATLSSNFRHVGRQWDCRQSVHCSSL
jgi:hypothetical protein